MPSINKILPDIVECASHPFDPTKAQDTKQATRANVEKEISLFNFTILIPVKWVPYYIGSI